MLITGRGKSGFSIIELPTIINLSIVLFCIYYINNTFKSHQPIFCFLYVATFGMIFQKCSNSLLKFSPKHQLRNSYIDYPSKLKRKRCMHFFSLKILNLPNRNSCINFVVSIANKISRFVHLHGSSSQTQDEFRLFKSNQDLNPDLAVTHFLR